LVKTICNKSVTVQVWWYTLVILATWEAKKRRIMVQGQPRQKVREHISTNKLGMVGMPVILAVQEAYSR
jgi:hypothetical protein